MRDRSAKRLVVRDARSPGEGRRTRASYPSRGSVRVRLGDIAYQTSPGPGHAESGDNAEVNPIGRRPTVVLGAGVVAMLAAVPVASAHGAGVPPAPEAGSFLLSWSFDPLVWLPAIGALLLWRHGVGRVRRLHPARPVARHRTVSWTLGIVALLVALDSGIERYDTTLFSVHMVQHLVLTLIAPPLLLFAGPITLLLQASTPEVRRRWILPVLHSTIVRRLSFPVVSWIVFARRATARRCSCATWTRPRRRTKRRSSATS